MIDLRHRIVLKLVLQARAFEINAMHAAMETARCVLICVLSLRFAQDAAGRTIRIVHGSNYRATCVVGLPAMTFGESL